MDTKSRRSSLLLALIFALGLHAAGLASGGANGFAAIPTLVSVGVVGLATICCSPNGPFAVAFMASSLLASASTTIDSIAVATSACGILMLMTLPGNSFSLCFLVLTWVGVAVYSMADNINGSNAEVTPPAVALALAYVVYLYRASPANRVAGLLSAAVALTQVLSLVVYAPLLSRVVTELCMFAFYVFAVRATPVAGQVAGSGPKPSDALEGCASLAPYITMRGMQAVAAGLVAIGASGSGPSIITALLFPTDASPGDQRMMAQAALSWITAAATAIAIVLLLWSWRVASVRSSVGAGRVGGWLSMKWLLDSEARKWLSSEQRASTPRDPQHVLQPLLPNPDVLSGQRHTRSARGFAKRWGPVFTPAVLTANMIAVLGVFIWHSASPQGAYQVLTCPAYSICFTDFEPWCSLPNGLATQIPPYAAVQQRNLTSTDGQDVTLVVGVWASQSLDITPLVWEGIILSILCLGLSATLLHYRLKEMRAGRQRAHINLVRLIVAAKSLLALTKMAIVFQSSSDENRLFTTLLFVSTIITTVAPRLLAVVRMLALWRAKTPHLRGLVIAFGGFLALCVAWGVLAATMAFVSRPLGLDNSGRPCICISGQDGYNRDCTNGFPAAEVANFWGGSIAQVQRESDGGLSGVETTMVTAKHFNLATNWLANELGLLIVAATAYNVAKEGGVKPPPCSTAGVLVARASVAVLTAFWTLEAASLFFLSMELTPNTFRWSIAVVTILACQLVGLAYSNCGLKALGRSLTPADADPLSDSGGVQPQPQQQA